MTLYFYEQRRPFENTLFDVLNNDDFFGFNHSLRHHHHDHCHRYNRRNPYRSLERQIYKAFNDCKDEENAIFKLENYIPNINLSEDEKNYYIHADLPGMTKEQVKMELNEDRILTISGERESIYDNNEEKEQNEENHENQEKEENQEKVEEEEEEENNNNINSSMSSSNSDTPNTNTIPQVIDENNDKSDSKLKVSPNLVEPTTTSALLKKENAESKDSSNLASSLPLSKNKSNNNSNNGTKSKILKDKNENKNKISKDKNETKNGTKKHKNLNSSSDTKKNHETATSLLEKILEKRPPLIQIKDGKDSNLKLKKKKNNNRSNKNEKRYGKKKKIRGTSNLETIKEDEELNNNKLPIRRVAKYTIDFKKDKPEQIIPHSMPRSRMPMSNKKQKIQNEIHSTLLNHTRQLQQRVFYLESKRLELQDLISDYELEKETLSKQLDKQTNSKVNYEKKIWELECKLYECNDSLNLTEESIAKLRNELEQKK